VNTTKRLSAWGIAFLLLLAAAGLGCGQSDNAEASTDTPGNEQDSDRAGDETANAAVAGSEGAEKAKGGDDEDDEDEEEPVPVEVVSLEQGEIEAVLRFSSNLEAEDEVQVFSQAKRLIRELLVEEGDLVRRDEVLIRLQDEEQRSQLAKVKSQLDKAEREFERQKSLFDQELISQQMFTDAKFDYEQKQIAVADAERELGYTEVRAPIAGTVTQRLVKVGDQVQIGQHLFDIVDFDSIVARVFVPEKHLEQLRPGLQARVTTAATGGRSFNGEVDRVAPVVDPRSGTVKVTIALGAQEGLRPGLYADVDLVVATDDAALLVPKRALVYDADQMFVYRLGEERRVERVFIEPVLTDKDHIEPLEGLDSGDQVVVAGQAGLKDKALVSLPGDEEEEDSDEADEFTETAQRISG
jgi:membrane fusion protein (multidrug efflux system)